METATLLTLLVQVILPLAVGLVTKKSTNKHVKTALLALFTVLNTGLVDYLSGNHNLAGLVLTGAIGLIISLTTHYGLYKPAGFTDRVQDALIKDKPAPVEEPVVEEEAVGEATEAETDAAPEAEADESAEAEVLDDVDTTALEGEPTPQEG